MNDQDDPLDEPSNPHRLLQGREVALALKASTGSLIKAAEALGVPVAKLSRFVHSRPKFQDLLKELRKTVVDVAESHFIDKVHEGDWKAVQLALTTLGRDRGFGAKEKETKVPESSIPSKLSDQDLLAEVARRAAAMRLENKPKLIENKPNQTE